MLMKNLRDTEQIAALEQRMFLLRQKNKGKIVLFTSSREKEGVSTIIINLSLHIAEKYQGRDILLIDANMNHPMLHKALNIPLSPGLSNAISENRSFTESIHVAPSSSSIHIVPSGAMGVDKKMINSESFSSFLANIESRYDWILIDAPPILESSDALSIINIADMIFLVVQAYKTTLEVVNKTKTYLEKQDCIVDGVILNRVRKVIPDWLYKRL